MTDLFVDLSSNNGSVDLAAHHQAGRRLIALKATEGDNYTWADHGRHADEWHKLGGNVWHYHFARPGNPQNQAREFLAVVRGHWKSGDRLVLDAEVAGISTRFVRLFIKTCHKIRPDIGPGLVYSYASFLTDARIQPVKDWGLWIADYTAKTPPKPVKGWKRLDAWQFTQTATGVPGIDGECDQSHLYVVTPKPKPKPPVPKPAPKPVKRPWWRRFKW